MSTTGIGAPVRRKEDQRFITGKGQYTDDINRPGQTYGVFVRSPHAHANIRRIDASAAKRKPGCLAVFTGEDVAADKVGALFCGWMITSKDGSPMKMAPHPALAFGKVNHQGDAVAVVIAETQVQGRDAAEKIKVDYEPLPAVTDPAKAKSGPQIHDLAPKNTIYEWSLGDAKAADAAFASAKRRELRRISSTQPASLRPNVVGSACTPWLRPMHRESLCSTARAEIAMVSASIPVARSSDASLSRRPRAVSSASRLMTWIRSCPGSVSSCGIDISGPKRRPTSRCRSCVSRCSGNQMTR